MPGNASTDCTSESTVRKGNLVCIAAQDDQDHAKSLLSLLSLSENLDKLEINNRYYRATASINWALLDHCAEIQPQGLQNCTVILLTQTVAQHSDLEKAKCWWKRFQFDLPQECVRLFSVRYKGCLPAAIDELREWGVENNIEIVCDEICEEDEISVEQRVSDALHCAPWPNITTGNDVKTNRLDVSLGESNRLRRALESPDIGRITNELLDLNDSASEAGSEATSD